MAFNYNNLNPNGTTADTAYGVYMGFEELPGVGFQPPMETSITTRGLWADNTGELLNFFTSSAQWSGSFSYYYEVWHSQSRNCEEVESFSVAYGHYAGSGSTTVGGGSTGDTPSKAIYGQYRSILLDGTASIGNANGRPTKFVDAAGNEMDHFYVVNLNRTRFKDKLDPGNFELNLVELSGSGLPNNSFTGSNVVVSSSNKVISLIDDSGDSNDSLGYEGIPLPVRNLVSGTIDGGIYNPSSPHYYGLVYPDNAVILINAAKLNQSCSFNTVTGSNVAGDNSMKLFKSISGSGTLGTGNGFSARSIEKKETAYYYVRVRPASANYSNNPTFVSGSTNQILNTRFINDPNVYVTSVGLYNQNRELLAVAKMSKPVRKNFNSELSVTVKLEY
jgi:hypothetical protein